MTFLWILCYSVADAPRPVCCRQRRRLKTLPGQHATRNYLISSPDSCWVTSYVFRRLNSLLLSRAQRKRHLSQCEFFRQGPSADLLVLLLVLRHRFEFNYTGQKERE